MILFLHKLKKKINYPTYWFKIVIAFALTGFIFGSLLYFKASPDLWGILAGSATFLVLLFTGIGIGNAAKREADRQIPIH